MKKWLKMRGKNLRQSRLENLDTLVQHVVSLLEEGWCYFIDSASGSTQKTIHLLFFERPSGWQNVFTYIFPTQIIISFTIDVKNPSFWEDRIQFTISERRSELSVVGNYADGSTVITRSVDWFPNDLKTRMKDMTNGKLDWIIRDDELWDLKVENSENFQGGEISENVYCDGSMKMDLCDIKVEAVTMGMEQAYKNEFNERMSCSKSLGEEPVECERDLYGGDLCPENLEEAEMAALEKVLGGNELYSPSPDESVTKPVKSWHLKKRTRRKAERGSEDDAPPKCNRCLKIFRNKLTLMVHMRSHLEEPVECDLCSKTFKNKYSLHSHKTTYHRGGKERYKSKVVKNSKGGIRYCDQCSKSYANVSSLRTHKSHVHQGKPRRHRAEDKSVAESERTCHICGKIFSNIKIMKTHLKDSKLCASKSVVHTSYNSLIILVLC